MKQRKYEVTAEQIALDIRTLIDGIFEAETETTEEGLLLNFTNGQQFRILVRAVVREPVCMPNE